MPKGIKGFQKGHKINKDKTYSLERRQNMSKGLIKTDNINKNSMHDWVKRWKGTPKKCEMCGLSDEKRTNDVCGLT